jgi:AraC-like DNA-binding protein
VDWLLDGVAWGAAVFHAGQYCGRWKATTAGHGQASFHLVLHGRCWLHRPGLEAVELHAGDGVFLLRDLPHFLSPYADAALACEPQAMQPLRSPGTIGAVGLACGFFSFEGPLAAAVADGFPDTLVLRSGDSALAGASAALELLRQEVARCGAAPSPLMHRLAGLLYFYALRHVALHDPQARGLWSLLRRPHFAPLVAELIRSPARPWSVEDMARRVHLSRAAFFRQFSQASGQSPLQFLLRLRMQLAARLLRQGEPIVQVAESAGYESCAAFSRAFKRTMGAQPGAWQRLNARGVTNGHNAATPGH